MTKEERQLPTLDPKTGRLLAGGTLAYLGDAVYEVAVRRYLVASGQTVPGTLHRLATDYVSAKAQDAAVRHLLDTDFLTETEVTYFKRGRNSSPQTKAKNTDAATYMYATGFEALIGYLDATSQFERLEEVVDEVLRFLTARKESKEGDRQL